MVGRVQNAPGATVVVGMSGSSGLAVVRALAPHGVDCYAVHFDGTTPAMATHLAEAHVCPDWQREPETLVDFLVGLAGDLRARRGAAGADADAPLATVFVCHDAALDPVWAGSDRLRAAGLLPTIASERSLEDLLDKRTQMAAAERAGVGAPWSRWGVADELVSAADDCPYPVLVKPAISHLGVSALGAKALRCETKPELLAALERVAGIEVLLQDFIPGGDEELYSAGVFACTEGHVAFTGRKLKQHPPTLGVGRLAEQVVAPGLVPDSVALLAEFGYEGISHVEFKRDPRDGTYRLMEANFRPWIWMGLATACGINLPLAAHRWAGGDDTWRRADERRKAVTDPPQRWVWAVPEAAHTLRGLRRGERPDVREWRGMRAEAFFSRRDPAPFVRSVSEAVGSRFRRGGADGRHGLSAALRAALSIPAAALTAAALRSSWRRAGGASVSGAAPALGLPAPGTVLVLAPHPDDETIMCGASIVALRRRGDDVRVRCVTRGTATNVGRPAAPSPDDAPVGERGANSGDVGELRVAELHAACATLGVDDVAVWDFVDRTVAAERRRLGERLGDEIRSCAPGVVIVPFPYDTHPDHVALTEALADVIEARLAAGDDLPAILCAAVQTPLSPEWATRLVPAGATWSSRRAAVKTYGTRGRWVFAAAGLVAHLHPARPGRPAEAFVDLPARAFVEVVRGMEDAALTVPQVSHRRRALSPASELLRTRGQREEITGLLQRALRRTVAPD